MPTDHQVQMKTSDQIDFCSTQSAHPSVEPSLLESLFHAVQRHPSFDPSDCHTPRGGNDSILLSGNESYHHSHLALSDVWGFDKDPLDHRLPNDKPIIEATTEALVDKIAGIIAPRSDEFLSDIIDEIIKTFSQKET
jgi:hypothetical protein